MAKSDILTIFKTTHYSITADGGRRNGSRHWDADFSLWLLAVAWCVLAHRRLAALWFAISSSLSSLSSFTHIHPVPPAHAHRRTRRWHKKKEPFWWINLYILGPIPVPASSLQRPWLLLSWAPLQPSGVISQLAVLNSLIICVLHKKRSTPQRHTRACSVCLGLSLMRIGCCWVYATGAFTLFQFAVSLSWHVPLVALHLWLRVDFVTEYWMVYFVIFSVNIHTVSD